MIAYKQSSMENAVSYYLLGQFVITKITHHQGISLTCHMTIIHN